MTQPSPQSLNSNNGDYLRSLLTSARRRPGLWIIPLFSAVLIAVLMAYLGPKTWDASQSIVVREELIGRIVGPGRFDSLDSMKTSQETIQEAARRPVVLRRVLKTLASVDGKTKDWNPSRQDIRDLQNAISFSAPGGAELGKTEILTVTVKADSPERAKALVEAVFDETLIELRTIRQRKAESMSLESRQAVDLAQERLEETTAAIQLIENSVGGDLNELRGLTQPYSSGGNMKARIAQIATEKRAMVSQRNQATQLITYLEDVASDPNQLIATPRELLDSQPSLSQLKNRLIEAQVANASLAGTFSEKHPRVQASMNALADIQLQIRTELGSSLVGLQSQADLANQQIASMDDVIRSLEKRTARIASKRVDYSRLSNEMDIRTVALSKAHGDYAQVESIQRAAVSVDFVSSFDEAEAGLKPLGPSKKTLVVAAAIAGSLIGLGLIMMVTPAPNLFPPRDGNEFQQATAPPAAVVATPVPAAQTQATHQASPDPFLGSSITTVSNDGGATQGFVIPDVTSGPPSMPNQVQ